MKHLRRAGVFIAGVLILGQSDCLRAQSMLAAPASHVAPQESAPTSTITIPAGTRVLMAMTTSLNTISATNESGLYLQTISPVIEENRVVIPPNTYVQGSVIKTARPGRIKGQAQLEFHFDRVILPNNNVLAISGTLAGLAGSHYEKKRSGTLQPVDQIDKDMKTVFSTTTTGAAIGALSGRGTGAWQGAAIGAATGLGIALFKRGDDIRLESGTRLEMIFDRDVTVPVSKLPMPTTIETKSPPPEPWHPYQ